jgi:hypothetical protein
MREDTYTYTARSAENPELVVTFTLHDHSMSVELGAPLEQVEKALQAKHDGAESQASPQPWLKPVAVSVMERVTRPFSIADVDASAEGDGLQVTQWFRTGGLRLAPITFIMKRVDNPEGAQAFVKELDERKTSTAHPGKFRGPLDYWAGWFLTGLLMSVLLLVGLRKKDSREME